MGSLHCHTILTPGPPSQLELRSSGEAGNKWGEHLEGRCLGLYQLVPEEAGQGGSKVYKQRHDRSWGQSYLYRWDVLLYKGRCNQDHDTNANRNGIPRAFHITYIWQMLNHVCLNQSLFKIGLSCVPIQSWQG